MSCKSCYSSDIKRGRQGRTMCDVLCAWHSIMTYESSSIHNNAMLHCSKPKYVCVVVVVRGGG